MARRRFGDLEPARPTKPVPSGGGQTNDTGGALAAAIAGAGDVPDWPDPPAAAAYHGFFGELVNKIAPETEADPIAVLLHLLVYFGSAAGRNAYRPVGPARHHSNLFVGLVGPTSMGGKGTSKSWADSIFLGADRHWASSRVSSGLSSGEGLIHAVRDRDEKDEPGTAVPDKRLCVVEEELAGVLRVSQRDGNTLIAVLRQAWDGGRLRVMTRNQPLLASDCHISVLGHITKDELSRTLHAVDVANGLANRFLWACCRISRLLPDGGQQLDFTNEIYDLCSRLERARQRKMLDRSAAATELWHAAYGSLRSTRPGVYGQVTARAAAQVLRLQVLYCLADGCKTVQRHHLESALAIWDYCDRSCGFIFGSGTGSDLADEILDVLRATPQGLTLTEISNSFGRHRSAKELKTALGSLKSARLAIDEKRSSEGSNGRPAEIWKVAKEAKEAKEATGKGLTSTSDVDVSPCGATSFASFASFAGSSSDETVIDPIPESPFDKESS